MAIKKEIELDIKVDSVETLKQQLREAQNEVNELSAKFGATSDAAVKAAKKAAELKDEIGDAKALTDAFNPDAKFNALTSSLGGVAAGFGAFQGALGLVGVQGEAVEATLLKVQSAMAISDALQQLGEAKDSFKQLGAVGKLVFKGIKAEVAATGIGLLVIAIGTIYGYWDDIKSLMTGVTAEQERLNVKSKQNLIIEKAKLEKLNNQDNVLKLQGLSEKQILRYKIAQTDEVIKKAKIELQNSLDSYKLQVKIEQRNKDILTGVFMFVTGGLQIILKTVSEVAKVLGKDLDLNNKLNKWVTSAMFDPKEVKKEGYEVYLEQKEALDKLRNDQAGYKLQVDAIDKEALDERKNINSEKVKNEEKTLEDINKLKNDYAELERKAKEEANRNELKNKQDFLEQIVKAENDYEDSKLSAKDKEIQDVNDKYFELIARAEQYNLDTVILKEAQASQLALIDEKYAEKSVKTEEKSAADLRDIKLKSHNQELDLASNAFKAVGDFTELMGNRTEKERRRAFKIKKAADLAGASIDGTKAILSAYADTPGGPIIKGVAAAIAGGFSAIQIAKIAKMQYSGGGDTTSTSSNLGGSNPSSANNPSSLISPNFNIVGNNGQNQLGQLGTPIQAYVVSGDMTSQQQLDRNRLRNATF
jgi:hypothetical protein